jgi:hypothetical protein
MQNLLSTLAASQILFIKMQHMYIYIANKFLHSNYWNLTPRQLCTKVTNLVIYDTALLLFPDDGPLRDETCKNDQRAIVI